MEQNGISIISPPGVTENSGKPKSIGITLRSSSLQSAKEKLKTPWLKKMEGDSTSLDKLLTVLAEVFGTAILVFLGCTAGVGSLGETPPPTMQVALAFGIAVMIAIQCIGHISGADINPAITVATVILGRKSLLIAGLYIIAQCLGSLIGYGLLKTITPQELLHDGNITTIYSFCTTDINKNITVVHGLLVEALATGILVFFACGIWDSRNGKNTDSVPLRFGLAVSMLAFAFIPYTGCSMNPARTFGPAIWNNYWDNHWIFWLGPIGGSIIASLIYRCLFMPRTKSQEGAIHDVETLNGVET
ncbi:aquaporin AQPAe.a-like isoform X1 [Anoplolepis gracilipes]|uniref:aquaporin AQPAe.a-like isoform X1 n=1 Tax=Anoplolepis gracilipes TaxID=354296 RepID=UPI003BA266C6